MPVCSNNAATLNDLCEQCLDARRGLQQKMQQEAEADYTGQPHEAIPSDSQTGAFPGHRNVGEGSHRDLRQISSDVQFGRRMK